MVETATSAQAEKAQKTMVAATRFVEEHKAPSYALIEKIMLPKGHKDAEVPKVGQFVFSDLTDGEDMTDEQTINITTTNLTVKEVGAKVIVTDVLVAQNATTPIFSLVGRQAGEGFVRQRDTEGHSCEGGMNGGGA